MNTQSGYSKRRLTDKYVLTADGGDKYFPIDLKSAYTGSGEGWYRIATSIKGIYNCEGTFEIYGAVAGRHTTCTITAGTCYGSNNSSHITLLHCSQYSAANPAISSIRIVYHSTYTNNFAYLEIYKPDTSNVNIKVNLVNGFGWTLTNPNTIGEIPSGYTSKELALISGNIATTGFTILNSNNSSVTGGDSSITVKINDVEKTLTIPANTDEKVAYTANTSNVAHPILFANNSTDTGTPTTGAVYYETNSTNSPGLTYNPYSNTLNTSILNIYNGGHIIINAAIKNHSNPMDQCLCIATPTTSTNLTIKNSPGIGFKVEGKSWASMIFNHIGPCFEFINANATANVNIKAAQLISSIKTGFSPLSIASTTLVNNLNADMLDSYHADDFYKKDDPIDADTLNGFKASDFTRIATINIRHSGSTGILKIDGTGIVGGSISVNLGQQISLPTHTINIDGTIQETLLMTLPSGITATVSTSSIVISINRNNLSNNGGIGQIKLLVY